MQHYMVMFPDILMDIHVCVMLYDMVLKSVNISNKNCIFYTPWCIRRQPFSLGGSVFQSVCYCYDERLGVDLSVAHSARSRVDTRLAAISHAPSTHIARPITHTPFLVRPVLPLENLQQITCRRRGIIGKQIKTNEGATQALLSSAHARMGHPLKATDEIINPFTTIHDGNFRRHSSMSVTIKWHKFSSNIYYIYVFFVIWSWKLR